MVGAPEIMPSGWRHLASLQFLDKLNNEVSDCKPAAKGRRLLLQAVRLARSSLQCIVRLLNAAKMGGIYGWETLQKRLGSTSMLNV